MTLSSYDLKDQSCVKNIQLCCLEQLTVVSGESQFKKLEGLWCEFPEQNKRSMMLKVFSLNSSDSQTLGGGETAADTLNCKPDHGPETWWLQSVASFKMAANVFRQLNWTFEETLVVWLVRFTHSRLWLWKPLWVLLFLSAGCYCVSF